jgi:hypothetical protein
MIAFTFKIHPNVSTSAFPVGLVKTSYFPESRNRCALLAKQRHRMNAQIALTAHLIAYYGARHLLFR